jgi:archaemetzincin
MRPVQLLRTEGVPVETLEELASRLARSLLTQVAIEPCSFSASHAWDPVRRQLHSTLLLSSLAALAGHPCATPLARGGLSGRPPSASILAVTERDLFVPVLTFVFGEAQVAGTAAVVSIFRLREEFYGLPPNPVLESERLFREALHELGHTFGLRHCDDWRCIMSPANSVERIDARTHEFCPGGRRLLALFARDHRHETHRKHGAA